MSITTLQALQKAIKLLDETYGPTRTRGAGEIANDFHALVKEEIVPDEAPDTDPRWHEYAVAAVRGFSSRENLGSLDVAKCAAFVADKVLELAKEQPTRI